MSVRRPQAFDETKPHRNEVAMTNRERMQAVLNGEKPDRLPAVEWATWWDLTTHAWEKQGAPKNDRLDVLQEFYGLDGLRQIWISPRAADCPAPAHNGAGLMEDEEGYAALKPYLYPEASIDAAVQTALAWKEGHERGDYAQWLTLEGFFWFPRTLFGIENHLYSFYDYPELLHQINQDVTEYHLRCLERLLPVYRPEFMTFAEDMSYNLGPMLSKESFDEFMLPYYKKVIPLLKEYGVKVLIDTDGNVEPLIPWFMEAGIEGVLPLERQAGVDVNRIRQTYPEWIMIGGYNKLIMHLGEEAMREEFQRIFPAMQSGRYIPSVDHQTPPDVTVEQYKVYVRLLKEYGEKAAEEWI